MNYGLRWPLQEEAGGDKGAGGGAKKEAGGEKKDDALGTVEDQARRMGWVPSEDFRGDKAKWTDAETFVKNGMESLPILRERNKTLQIANDQLSKSLGEFKKMSDTNFAKGYEKAKAELEASIQEKAAAGDGKGAAKDAGELAALEADKARRDAKVDDDPVFSAWEKANPWYQDQDLRIESEAIAFKLRRKGEKKEGVEFLDLVKEEMKKQFPEKFGNPRREASKEGGGVERPNAGGDGGGNKGKKGWEQLPPEAKESGERYVKQKLFKDKAEYAAQYWAQN